MSKQIAITNGIDTYLAGPLCDRYSVHENMIDVFDDMVQQFLDSGGDALRISVYVVDMTDDEIDAYYGEQEDD